MTIPRPRVVVLDYGSGNLRSAQRALQRAGADAVISSDTAAAGRADGLVVPGVGAFAACMAGLRAAGGAEVIARRVAAGLPVLGICVGMQVLFETGIEHGEKAAGLGCWPGIVQKLTAPVLPHMGWNVVSAGPQSRLLAGLGADAMFYFVHSYAALDPLSQRPGQPEAPLTGWTTHGEPFLAVVEDGQLMATQFHPEKSADAGVALLANWLGTLR